MTDALADCVPQPRALASVVTHNLSLFRFRRTPFRSGTMRMYASTCTNAVYTRNGQDLEPTVRIELTTNRLQSERTAFVLRWHVAPSRLKPLSVKSGKPLPGDWQAHCHERRFFLLATVACAVAA